MSSVKKGDPVEFTREHIQHYKMGDGEFGIATEDERPGYCVTVELADGSTYLARHIHAFAWMGWLPEELEPAFERLNEYRYGPADGSDYIDLE